MKITDVKAVYPNWRRLPEGAWQSHFWQIVVEVRTDTGVVGLGYGGGGQPAVEVVNSHFRELLLGRTIDGQDDIRETWDLLYSKSLPYGRKGIPVMALSGVDLALWDLLAKAGDRPVYEVLGGLRKEKVRAYASTETFGARPRRRIHRREVLIAVDRRGTGLRRHRGGRLKGPVGLRSRRAGDDGLLHVVGLGSYQ